MGRKSSAKAQTRSATTTPTQPPDEPRSFSPLLVVALLAAAVAVAAFVYVKRGDKNGANPTAAQNAETAQSQTSATPPPSEVPEIKRKSYPQAKMPPLPVQ